MNVIIREMDIGDYDQVIQLWQGTEGVGLSSADSREAIERYLHHNPGMSFVAISKEGVLVGAVLCGHDGRRGYLHHLSIRPDFRRQGIAHALVDRCLARLQVEGIEKSHIFVYKTNMVGQAFWRDLGWIERETLLIMSKNTEG